jgi:hypothetical protein
VEEGKMSKKIEQHYPGGITCTMEIVSQWKENDTKHRKVRLVSVSGPESNTKSAFERHLGKEYVEFYQPADRYDSARWTNKERQ